MAKADGWVCALLVVVGFNIIAFAGQAALAICGHLSSPPQTISAPIQTAHPRRRPRASRHLPTGHPACLDTSQDGAGGWTR